MSKLWIVMPLYYDVDSFMELRNMIRNHTPQCQFVILDDSAGQDPQMKNLHQLLDVQVVEPPFNLGHQRGLVYALRKISTNISNEDKIITMDSDGEDRPEDVAPILEALKGLTDISHSIVTVQRTKRKESLLFKSMYFCYKSVFRTLTGTIIRSGNFAGYHGAFLKRYITHPYFDLCYSSTLVSLQINRIPIAKPRGTRLKGQSKMNLVRLIMHGIRMLMPFMDQIAIRSLMAFAALFGTSIVLSTSVVGIKYLTDSAIPGWATYTLLLSFLMSFVALGNFLILFSIFSQSQGMAMSHLESAQKKEHESEDESIRAAS